MPFCYLTKCRNIQCPQLSPTHNDRCILTRNSTFRDGAIRGVVTFNWTPPLDVSVPRLCKDATVIKDGTSDVWLWWREDDGVVNWSTLFEWDVNDGGDHKCETDVSSATLNVSGCADGDACLMPSVSSTEVISCTNGGSTWLLSVSEDGLLLGTDTGLLYPNITSDMDDDRSALLVFWESKIMPWLILEPSSNGSLTEEELAAVSDRSSKSCFSMMAGRRCRPDMSNMRASANPYAAATAGDADAAGECRVNCVNLSGTAAEAAAAAVLSPVTTSSLPSSRSFRPTSCEVWKGSTVVDVDWEAARSGLVGVPCFRRRRCSINGTAGGELQSGRLPVCWDPAVEKLGCAQCRLDEQETLADTTNAYNRIDWVEGFTSHMTQNRSFRSLTCGNSA